jgi:hypothetical protein
MFEELRIHAGSTALFLDLSWMTCLDPLVGAEIS